MAEIELIMPMAGAGQRFRAQGFTTPKPLVLWKDRPLFLHALDSLRGILKHAHLTVLVSEEDRLEEDLAAQLERSGFGKKVDIISLVGRTRGPAATVAAGLERLSDERPIVALDCDLSFHCSGFEQDLLGPAGGHAGALCTFNSDLPKYSYLRANGDEVECIREKEVISNMAVLGAYFFRRAGDFRSAFGAELQQAPLDREIYVSHIVQRLLNDGRRFRWHPSDTYRSLGTPEDL